jgi:response regulator of citrate/malate metabolism
LPHFVGRYRALFRHLTFLRWTALRSKTVLKLVVSVNRNISQLSVILFLILTADQEVSVLLVSLRFGAKDYLVPY